MQPIQFFAARVEDGALLPGATVDVFVHGSQERAKLFSDSPVTVPAENPVHADMNAKVFFYTTAPRIDIRISRYGYVAPLLVDISTLDAATAVELVQDEIDKAIGKIDGSLLVMEQKFDDLIKSIGFESVYLEYVAGVTIERSTQLVRRLGEMYMVKDRDQVPLTLTGNWSVDTARLTAVGDASLRAALGTPEGLSLVNSVFGSLDSAIQTVPLGYEYSAAAKPWGTGDISSYGQLVLHGGVLYKYIGSTLPKSISGNFESEPSNTWIRAGENLSAYVPSVTKKEDLSSKITSGYMVVITGDSLPFNAFQFPSSTPLLPADYAYKNSYGLAAWGHMVRDSIYSSASDFKLAKNAHIITSPGMLEAQTLITFTQPPLITSWRRF